MFKMFSRWKFCVFVLFTACGFYPEVPTISRNQKTLFAILLFHLYNFIMFVSSLDDTLDWMNKCLTKLDMTNETLQNVIAPLAYCLISIESFVKRKTMRRFWELYEDMLAYSHAHRNSRMLCKYLAKFIECFIFSNAAIIYILVDANEDSDFMDVPYLFAQFVLSQISQIHLFYYLFYLELINFELKIIESKVKQELLCSLTLKLLQKHYQSVYKMSECINSVFGWSSSVAILSVFTYFLTDTNWFYYHYSDESGIFLLIFALWSFHFLLHLIYTFNGGSQCTTVVNLRCRSIAHEIHVHNKSLPKFADSKDFI